MFVQIKGVQRENFTGVWRAGRFWPSAESLRVEVLKQDDDPPLVEEEVADPATGKKSKRAVHSTVQIGRKTFELLKADGRISILGDGETDSAISSAVLSAAQRDATEARARVAALEAENAALKEQLTAVGEEVAAFQRADETDSSPTKTRSRGK